LYYAIRVANPHHKIFPLSVDKHFQEITFTVGTE